MLSALLIKDQNSKENSKTYLTMLSLTIGELQEIIPKLMAFAERMVQTCKKRLQKICLIRNKEDWDLTLPYIAMGYKMSKHTSLFHFSPYFLLFGRRPIPPSSIVVQME
jgi:hypothetical protein